MAGLIGDYIKKKYPATVPLVRRYGNYLRIIREGILSRFTGVAYSIFHFVVNTWDRSARREFVRHKHRFPELKFEQVQRTTFTLSTAWRWNARHCKPVLFVLVSPRPEADLRKFERVISRNLHGRLLVINRSELGSVGTILIKDFSDHDLVILDGNEQLPNPLQFISLKHAAYKYGSANRLAMVTPSHADATGERRSIFGDRDSGQWRIIRESDVRSYGQNTIPRYVLGAQGHGAYIKNEDVRAFGEELVTQSLDELINHWIRLILNAGRRVLEFSPTTILSQEPNLSAFGGLGWFFDRTVTTNTNESLPIIFVLPATSMSGGIRAVLELSERLLSLGENVQVWSLQGNPTWMTVSLGVKEFNSYADLTDALAAVEAVKVATWWETAEPVFLASINRGVPVQYVQEFESWFYPDMEGARAAVISNYRPEFCYTTTASYQQKELSEVGIISRIIPPGFNEETFNYDPRVNRRDDVLLALGRSFFQKNFVQSASAWKLLGSQRPNLQLFGFEPEILNDEKVEYLVEPSDIEIAKLYRSSTAFIQTSIHEGFSLPLIEAMASGCPVITTNAHGNMDFCVDGENCIVVGLDDVAGTAEAIKRLMDNPALRMKLSKAALRTAQRYTWSRVAQEMKSAYRQFASQGDHD